MWARRRARPGQAGMNLIELRIAGVILTAGLVLFSVSRYGLSWAALKPFALIVLGLLATSVVLSAMFILPEELGPALDRRRLQRFLAHARAGRADQALACARAISDAGRLRQQVEALRAEALAGVGSPGPLRPGWLRLLLALPLRAEELALLARAPESWPEEDLPQVLEFALLQSGPGAALAGALLARAGPAMRGELLERLFRQHPSSPPGEPTPAWLAALAPHRAELEALRRREASPRYDLARLDRYLAALAQGQAG